jgi:hypothetical protein
MVRDEFEAELEIVTSRSCAVRKHSEVEIPVLRRGNLLIKVSDNPFPAIHFETPALGGGKPTPQTFSLSQRGGLEINILLLILRLQQFPCPVAGKSSNPQLSTGKLPAVFSRSVQFHQRSTQNFRRCPGWGRSHAKRSGTK